MTKKYWIAILVVAGVALALRLPGLAVRPMHGDEAVHAYKFGELLEENYYRYDPHEYHGPTLNYFTLIAARLTGRDTYASLNEFTLRIVPVFFGFALVLMPLLIVKGIGKSAVLIAAVLTAISPAFVFYSRYYIQEMLLVCFTFAAIAFGFHYARTRKLIWLIPIGISIGLMHATKETCVIAYVSMLAALIPAVLLGHKSTGPIPKVIRHPTIIHCLVLVVVAFVVSSLFYSSFFTNPHGVIDSLKTYSTYFDRAGNNQLHIHPWYYYLRMLLYSPTFTHKPPWTEGVILVLAVVGLFLIIIKKALPNPRSPFLIFLASYTIIITVIYALIPYKTPWCLLSFFHGIILLAAVGAATILKSASRLSVKIIVSFALALAASELLLQAVLVNFAFYADNINPHVYAHPTTDVYKITACLPDTRANSKTLAPVTVIADYL